MSDLFDPRLPTRFWDKVIPEPNSGCWLWLGATGKGYGRYSIPGKTSVLAHRISFEAANGPAPTGLDLDHLCRQRSCCNPQHLEPVTRRTNLMRGQTLAASNAEKTHCSRGHALTPNNIWSGAKSTHRQCKTCFYAKRRERTATWSPEQRKKDNDAQRSRRLARKGGAA